MQWRLGAICLALPVSSFPPRLSCLDGPPCSAQEGKAKKKDGALDQFTVNLNEKALAGKVDPLIGHLTRTRLKHPTPKAPTKPRLTTPPDLPKRKRGTAILTASAPLRSTLLSTRP